MSNTPAFPTNNWQKIVPMSSGYSEGMTLRDYFAAKAMQALLRQYPDHLMNSPSNEVACDAYSMADAMLSARGQK
jgi:hypothetical protein